MWKSKIYYHLTFIVHSCQFSQTKIDKCKIFCVSILYISTLYHPLLWYNNTFYSNKFSIKASFDHKYIIFAETNLSLPTSRIFHTISLCMHIICILCNKKRKWKNRNSNNIKFHVRHIKHIIVLKNSLNNKIFNIPKISSSRCHSYMEWKSEKGILILCGVWKCMVMAFQSANINATISLSSHVLYGILLYLAATQKI